MPLAQIKTGSQILKILRCFLSGMRAVRATFLNRGARSGGFLAFCWLTIIRSVKTRAFKYYTGTSCNQPFYFIIALRAFFKRFIGYLLEYVKNFIAMRAFIFISRHLFNSPYLKDLFILSVKLSFVFSPERRANSSIALRCSKVNR